MKILFANNLCGHFGGVEQVIAHTAPELVRRGHECHLAYGRVGGDPESFARPFASVAQCRDFTRGKGSQGEAFEEIVARVRPDVLFVHKLDRLPDGAELNTELHKVVMVHDHDLWCPTGLGYDRRTRKMCTHSAGWQCYLSLAFLERRDHGLIPFAFTNVHGRVCEMRRYHHFNAILPNSNFIREKLLANGFPFEKTRLCHPVLNQPALEPAPVPEEPIILFVGSLIRGKGVDLLLHALTELYCDYKVYIVGTGKSQGELRDLAASLGIAGAVNFTGWLPNDQVAKFYRAAKVVAVPSAWPEPFGLVGHAARAAGGRIPRGRYSGLAGA